MTAHYIYDFDSWSSIPDKNLLGSKGFGLAEMSRIGLPIPHGFTISTDLCASHSDKEMQLSLNFLSELDAAIARLERKMSRTYGGNEPLLLSVRSGAFSSMPGMMDTILNLGMNEDVMENLSLMTNIDFALDTYSRFLKAYGTLVLKIKSFHFPEVSDLRERVKIYQSAIDSDIWNIHRDPKRQLLEAIKAVLDSWTSPRARYYRKLHHISDFPGTAVNIQAMVFGNMGDKSGTGVVFTRNPSTGAKEFYGEFLLNAQGEDIVSGARTPHTITPQDGVSKSLKDLMPEVFLELKENSILLENYFLDMQDIEFTIEQEKLYILQTRSAKRTANAAVKIVVDMVKDGKITEDDAILKIAPESLNQLLHASVDRSKNPSPFAKGLSASPGAAAGAIIFCPQKAQELVATGVKVVLVRSETSPEDIHGMHVSEGILTARGGMTSHAAVVARGMGKPCVCGVHDMEVREADKILAIGDITLKEYDMITIDGSTGEIFLGIIDTVTPEFSSEFNQLIGWADMRRKMRVRANADTAHDVQTALKLGAEGVGLCRTEHMFFEQNKLHLMREMIISYTGAHQDDALAKLLPLHKNDFKEIFSVMNGFPINIRLLDPPLHEFLPHEEKERELLADALGMSIQAINQRLQALEEANPMLGHRGCRLGITCPGIYQMQVKAIILAAIEVKLERNIDVDLEIMVPLIANIEEFKILHSLIKETASECMINHSCEISYKIGTMIELPRAALIADQIARLADYFSFGTNDLTQTTYGISRDDVASFIPEYINRKIFTHDPFVTIDRSGVGELIKIARDRGYKENSFLKFGVCGEHGGDTESIEFFESIGMHYVSCSPYRIPIARLAAARASIRFAS